LAKLVDEHIAGEFYPIILI